MSFRLTRKKLHIVLSLFLISLLPQSSFAWGASAHLIVAQIAYDRVSQRTKSVIRQILGKESFVSASTWADSIRVSRPELRSQSWHFVDIPLEALDYNPARDCRDGCLVSEIGRFSDRLRGAKLSAKDRAEALKFLMHLITDAHQPMHCIDNQDKGGNMVSVTFFGKPSNLHKVWDQDIIEKTGLSETAYVKKLEANLPVKEDGGSAEAWVLESHKLAIDFAYKYVSNRALGNAYYRICLPIVDRQLARAGVRLAHLLDELLG